ncbi:MAG TPA: SgcJ/EcaC family oxidoreductase [Longimicrobium sp.]|nr:SgcJ/EcaC family oxidoreductase [Longimicrobium sp.]
MKPIALLALLSSLAACSPARPAVSPMAAAQEVGGIVTMLEVSTQGWNRGDLDAFLVPYADDATFVGSRGLLRGKPAIRAQYQSSYFGAGRVRGTLRFEGIEVRMLGPRSALAVGRYVVTERGAGQADATGLFTLALERRAEGWRIIHDHSS